MTDASRRTLAHYQRNAQAFEAGTRDHDVSQNIQALLRHLPARPGLAILDFGCGPGRDLLTFKALGHLPVGLDGCAAFVDMARQARFDQELELLQAVPEAILENRHHAAARARLGGDQLVHRLERLD